MFQLLFQILVSTLFIINTFCFNVFSQQYPSKYFRSPLDIPLSTAGTFGELRSNHFHSGLDLKTNAMEGLRVYAIGDGYVSRIKVQASGFGKAVYITHANGYVSVYAHLKQYNDAISAYVKSIQYQRESFEVDLYLKPNEILVKRGDVIALSGNTGSSGGPHLHFEIRDSRTEAILNPQLFGFTLVDNLPPKLESVIIYPLDENSRVNGSTVPQKIKLRSISEIYRLPEMVTVTGKIGFGISCIDKQNDSPNENGIYSLELFSDGKMVYKHELEKFTFDQMRYINGHIDYTEKMRSGVEYQRCFVLPNNKLETYKHLVNRGILNFTDSKEHVIQISAKDAQGNTSNLYFEVVSSPLQAKNNDKSLSPRYEEIIPYNKPTIFKREGIVVGFNQSCLFDSLYFEYSANKPVNGCYSLLHRVHKYTTPLFSAYTLSIKAVNLPENLRSKALIASFNEKGILGGEGGSYEGGYVSCKMKKFGNFGIAVDVLPPKIDPLNISYNRNMHNVDAIRFKISDNLSGVRSYRCTIDDKWVLAEFDLKTSTLSYTFDEHVQPGQHRLKLIVTDAKNNAKAYETSFSR